MAQQFVVAIGPPSVKVADTDVRVKHGESELPDTTHEIGIFEIHEESLVKTADCLDQLSPNKCEASR